MRAGPARAMRAEWTKFWSARGTRWTAFLLLFVTVGMTALLASASHTDATQAGQGDDDVVANSLSGVRIGLLVAITLGVLIATSEYTTGLIRTTFAAIPARWTVLLAKVAVVGVVTAVVGLVASLVSFLVAQPVIQRNGYVAPAYPPPSLATEPVLRAVIGSGLFLAALALLSLGVGVILRSTAAAITTLVAVTFVPLIIAEPGSPLLPAEVGLWVRRLGPMAGLAIQQTRERPDTAIGPWAGLAVLCAYAVVVLLVAGWLLNRRDAA